MTLLTIKNCSSCDEVKKVIHNKNISISISELIKSEDKYVFDGIKIPEQVGFPILFFGKDKEGKPNMLAGEEGIISYLTSGYVMTSGKFCPLIKKDCVGKKCSKFNIFYKGMIPEGACSDFWTPVLLTELISKRGNYGD